MHIISKEKDSYDYLVGKWGVDKNITLDRTSFDSSIKNVICDMEQAKSDFEYFGYLPGALGKERGIDVYHYLLKVGNKYFLIRGIENYKDFTFNMELMSTFENLNVQLQSSGESIIALYSASIPWAEWAIPKIKGISHDEYIKSLGDEAINRLTFRCMKTNFYLCKNGFGFLDQEEVYLAIYSYLSSLKKDKESTQSNDGKIVSHGFDKKKSFRKMKR